MRTDERVMLEPWLAAFERAHGAPASLNPHPFAHRMSVGPLLCLRIPPVEDRTEILGGTGHFVRRPALAAHVRALGFEWDPDDRIRTTPTPETFNQLLEIATDGASGYRLVPHREDVALASTGPWLHRYLEGAIPVHIASPEFYAATPVDEDFRWQLTTLLHDLTVHALNYHLIPRSVIHELAERIRRATFDRIADCDRNGAKAPLTLATFFDNDLNRYCYEVWFVCERPSDFAPVFTAPENLAQLYAALDTRIRETLAGLGDVATGCSDDLPPLAEAPFAITRRSAGATRRSDR